MANLAGEEIIVSPFADSIGKYQLRDGELSALEAGVVIGSLVTHTYKNYGYCTIHNVLENWVTTDSPSPTPPSPASHTIAAGTSGYFQLT